MMLYKYCDWNEVQAQKNHTKNYTKENLINSQLRFNTPENFNDPFDIFASFKIKDREEVNKKLNDIENVKSFSDEEVILFNTKVDRSHINNCKYGITCFSKKCNNILMWSHYANKHEGICLGFDIDDAETFIDRDKNIYENIFSKEAICRLLEIRYQKNRPVFYILDDNNNSNNIVKRLLSTKNKVWNYEREYRIMIMDSNNNRITFPSNVYYKSNKLKKIILGSNMSLANYAYLYQEALMLFNNIKIYISKLNLEKYSLDIFELSREKQERLYRNYEFLRNNTHEDCSEFGECWSESVGNININDINTYFSFMKDYNLENIVENRSNYRVKLEHMKDCGRGVLSLIDTIKDLIIYNLSNQDKVIRRDLF